ncbi:MAG: hypothetical protein GY835_10415 [bacterium]|nr:hypothetical protein [bacterium]
MKKNLVVFIIVSAFLAMCYLGIKHDIPNLDPAGTASSIPMQTDGPIVSVMGLEMREVLNWGFEDGHFPQNWGWGEWEVREGHLWGKHETGAITAYFLPVDCGQNFIIETSVKAVAALPGKTLSMQLLIRESEWVHFETGVSILGNSNDTVVRHMARGTNFICDIIPSETRFELGQWYLMQIGIINGRIKALVDGQEIKLADLKYPLAASYTGPHFSLEFGEAEFDYFKVYALP